MESLTINFASPLLYDRLLILSAEYTLSPDLLVNIAVKRLLDDVDTIRSLREGKVEL